MLTQGLCTQKESMANKEHNAIKDSLCYISLQSKQSYWQNDKRRPGWSYSLHRELFGIFTHFLQTTFHYREKLAQVRFLIANAWFIVVSEKWPGCRNKLTNSFRSSDIQGHPTYQLRSYFRNVLSLNSIPIENGDWTLWNTLCQTAKQTDCWAVKNLWPDVVDQWQIFLKIPSLYVC